jgi:hypothetical protein
MDIINKIGNDYFVICILGKADCEEDKIFYKKHWMECYNVLDEFLEKCKVKTICSSQSIVEIPSWGKDGYPKTNFKNAPTGGKLKWDKKNNEKICEKYLNELLGQIKESENEGMKHYKWLESKFPEIKNTISFEYHEVIGHIEKDKETQDFMLRAYPGGLNNYWNQEIVIFISKTYMKLQKEKIETFYNKIGNIAKSVLTGTTNMPLAVNIKEGLWNKIMYTLWTIRWGLENELGLKENPVGKWKIIK